MDMQVETTVPQTALVFEYAEKINACRGTGIVEAGRLLAEFKEKTRDEGTYWGDLLKVINMSRDTADRTIRAFVVFGDRAASLRHIPPTIVGMLAAPGTPAPVREQLINRLQEEKMSVREVKAEIDKGKPPGERKDNGADDFRVIDVRNGQICGYANKNRGGQLDVFIEDGRQPELWYSLVGPDKEWAPPGANY